MDIRILIREATAVGYPVEIDGPSGQYSDGVISLGAYDVIADLVQRIDSLIGNNGALPPEPVLNELNSLLKQLGLYLFNCLDVNDKRLLHTVESASFSSHKPLQFQLRIRDPDVRNWPWELLYKPHDEGQSTETNVPFVALNPHIRLSRYHEKPIAIPQLEKLEQLRVLVVTADSYLYGPLPSFVEAQLEDYFGLPTTMLQRISLHILKHATPKLLVDYLRQAKERFHIIHFIGHGYVREHEAGLCLESDGRNNGEVSAQLFVTLLNLSSLSSTQPKTITRRPSLIILDACHSAHMRTGVSSVTQELIENGISAVIGMRTQVNPVFVNVFNQGLYSHLLDGFAIDEAVARCRRVVRETFSNELEWSIPTLYLRADDGQLFARDLASNQAQTWIEQLQLLKNLRGQQVEEATQALVKLGVSTLSLLVTAILSYPLEIVRARAVAVLRNIEQPSETRDRVIRILGLAIENEPSPLVRQEMVRLIVEPEVRDTSLPFLERFVHDEDPIIRQIAIETLFSISKSGIALGQRLDEIRRGSQEVARRIAQLSTIVGETLKPGIGYGPYINQVERARVTAQQLRNQLLGAQRDANRMTAATVVKVLNPKIAEWVQNMNNTMQETDRIALNTESLVSRLVEALSELAHQLNIEVNEMRQIEQLIRSLDGIVITDADRAVHITINVEQEGVTLKRLSSS